MLYIYIHSRLYTNELSGAVNSPYCGIQPRVLWGNIQFHPISRSIPDLVQGLEEPRCFPVKIILETSTQCSCSNPNIEYLTDI